MRLSQKRMAAEILKVGVNRIRVDQDGMEEVSKAITREDIRDQIGSGAIFAKPIKGVSRGRIRRRKDQIKKGRHKGHGGRSGRKNARAPRKREWIRKIRAIRDELRKIKEDGGINKKVYRKLYLQAKGNLFHSRRHLREHVDKIKSR